MPKDFLPSRDADFRNWTENFASLLVATPLPFGITAPQATAYQTQSNAFIAAYETAIEPTTRTRPAISTKDTLRDALKVAARDLARIIQAHPGLTNAQRLQLGLAERGNEPTPIHAPTEVPLLKITKIQGRLISMELRSLDSNRRGRPIHVDGAQIMSFVGPSAPQNLTDWSSQGLTTRTSVDIELPPTIPVGSIIWFTAAWFSPRKQFGPFCQAVSVAVQDGYVQQAS